MENERLIIAIGRIERALTKIENAPANLPEKPLDTELSIRHNELKDKLKKAISSIDGLIAERGR